MRRQPHRPMITMAAIAVALGLLAGCSSGTDQATSSSIQGDTTTSAVATSAPATSAPPSSSPVTSAPGTSAPTTSAPPTSAPEENGDAALGLFVTLRQESCADAEPPTPEPVSVEPGPSASEFVVVDTEDNRVVINVGQRVVYSTDGPDGVLPYTYSFGCDPEVFQGTLDS